jgi:sigma-B regulation protein RsbQ
MAQTPAGITEVRRRNNVTVTGPEGGRPIVFAHGFGCSQEMWREVAPHFAEDYRVVLFDHVGAGGSDIEAYDRGKYDSLHGYADDLLEIMDDLDLHDAVYVGHSVSAMMGVLAATRDPSRFGALVLVGPSPRYIDAEGYTGGFEQADIDSLLDALDANYLGWSATMAPLIMGNGDRPQLGEELTTSFCSVDPAIAAHFARVTFLSDNRRDLQNIVTPTLILQCNDDLIAPRPVGEYVHQQIPGSELVVLSATGHCPNLSAPGQVIDEIRAFLR